MNIIAPNSYIHSHIHIGKFLIQMHIKETFKVVHAQNGDNLDLIS